MATSSISPELAPLRILHISATKSWGGGENHLENLCHELWEFPEVTNYILCAKEGLLHQRLKTGKIPFYTSPLAHKMDPRFFLKIGVLCKKNSINLIHIHDTTALSLTVMADYFYELPPFIFSKKTSFPIKQRRQTLFKYNYPKIKAILCVSEKTREITAKSIQNTEKLKVVFHGTRLGNSYKETHIDLKKQFNLGAQVKIIGNIANHIRAKHLEAFIEVADLLINGEGRKDLFFVQVGRFSNRTQALKNLIKEKKLEQHVKLLGFIPEASQLLPQFDVSLVTSQSEGIPQFIYESFFHEVPIVSTNVGGIPEIIAHRTNGLLADKYDYHTLAQHIVTLSEDTSLQKEFTKTSRRILIEGFTTQKMALQTLEAYKKATNTDYGTGS